MIQAPLVWEDRAANLAYFAEQLRHIEGKTDLVVLPETFTTGFSMNAPQLADTMDGETVATLKAWARKYNIGIAGSFIATEEGKYFNRAFLITPETEHYYDKRHLFTYGGEDKHFTAGRERVIVEYGGVRFLLLICYDLRFPVWSRNRKDYDAILYVANWPTPRVEAWLALLKARAIENQCYVAGVNRVGTDPSCEYCGGTLWIDPYGNTVAACERGKVDAVTVELDMGCLTDFRRKFPVLEDGDEFKLEL